MKGTIGPWADVSRRFASETTGDILLYIGDKDPSVRIWWNTEMPAILNESNAMFLNGVPIENYRKLYQQLLQNGVDDAIDNICRAACQIKASNTNVNALNELLLYYDINGKLVYLDESNLKEIRIRYLWR